MMMITLFLREAFSVQFLSAGFKIKEGVAVGHLADAFIKASKVSKSVFKA